MLRLIHIFVLSAFVLAIFTSLWLLSSCSTEELAQLQPFATFSGVCSSFGGVMHVQIWTNLLLTFTLTLAVTALIVLLSNASVSVFQTTFGKRLGMDAFFVPLAERTPNMKHWDPLREALAAGVIQRGSRNQ